MSKHLDLDDVAAMSPVAMKELAELRAENERSKLLSPEADRYEALRAIIVSRSWLSEGRGSYEYNDPQYDAEVRAFVWELLEALPSYASQPFQEVLKERNGLRAQVTILKARLRPVEELYKADKDQIDNYSINYYGFASRICKVIQKAGGPK